MKSKAQEYADAISNFETKIRPFYFKYSHGNSIQVGSLGDCLISIHAKLSPREALQLRDWLTDTFDVPNQIDLDGVYETKHALHGYDWVKSIHIGFVGKTREGEKMTYMGRHGEFYVWEHPDYDYDMNFISRVRMYEDKDCDFDIIAPWEG